MDPVQRDSCAGSGELSRYARPDSDLVALLLDCEFARTAFPSRIAIGLSAKLIDSPGAGASEAHGTRRFSASQKSKRTRVFGILGSGQIGIGLPCFRSFRSRSDQSRVLLDAELNYALMVSHELDFPQARCRYGNPIMFSRDANV